MLTQQPKAWREKIGSLNCAVIQGDDAPPRTVVVLCHGFGAPGDDLVSIALELMHQGTKLASGVQFVFPEAPMTLESLGMPGGRAWWMIDTERLMASQRGEAAKRDRNEKPAGLETARNALSELVTKISAKTKLPLSKFILGGFSQGAMVMTDLALRQKENVAGLAILSGTLLNEDEWKKNAANHKGLRVVQSHGRQDPLLSFQLAEELRNLLTAAGAEVHFLAFDGGHTITVEALRKLVQLIEAAD
jgi:phospholipase/carboxylesterase